MNDSKVISLQSHRQCLEKLGDLVTNLVVSENGGSDFTCSVQCELFAEEPVIVVLAVVQKDVEVVITQNALSCSRLNETLNKRDNTRTVRSTVCQITNENESSLLRVRTIGSVAKMLEKILQCIEFTVNISHDVKRAVEQITYKTFRHSESKLHAGH